MAIRLSLPDRDTEVEGRRRIDRGLAPLVAVGTDTNPRCDRCKCPDHDGRKCPNRFCGCRQNRPPQ